MFAFVGPSVGTRASRGFSTLAIAFVMLALTIPIVFIAESTLVAARQATNNALGQENLRAIDSSMSEVMGEVRLDEGAVNVGVPGHAPGGIGGVSPSPTATQAGTDQHRDSVFTGCRLGEHGRQGLGF
jgi:hypothetical protein